MIVRLALAVIAMTASFSSAWAGSRDFEIGAYGRLMFDKTGCDSVERVKNHLKLANSKNMTKYLKAVDDDLYNERCTRLLRGEKVRIEKMVGDDMACIYPDGDTKCYWTHISERDRIEGVEPRDKRNEDMAPLEGRVAVGAKGHLTQEALVCPESGLLNMVLADKDYVRAASKSAGWGCSELSVGDSVAVEDGMPQ